MFVSVCDRSSQCDHSSRLWLWLRTSCCPETRSSNSAVTAEPVYDGPAGVLGQMVNKHIHIFFCMFSCTESLKCQFQALNELQHSEEDLSDEDAHFCGSPEYSVIRRYYSNIYKDTMPNPWSCGIKVISMTMFTLFFLKSQCTKYEGTVPQKSNTSERPCPWNTSHLGQSTKPSRLVDHVNHR